MCADDLAEPLDEVVELLGAGGVRYRRAQGPVGVGEVAQDHALGAGQLVVGDELPDVIARSNISRTSGLGREVARVDPGVALPVGAQRLLEQVGEGPGPGDVVEGLHPLLVLQAVGLDRGDRLAAGLELLGQEHGARVVEGGLDDADDVERVAGGRGVEQLEGGEGEGRQRLVECEPLVEVEGDLEGALVVAPAVPAQEALQRGGLGRRVFALPARPRGSGRVGPGARGRLRPRGRWRPA